MLWKSTVFPLLPRYPDRFSRGFHGCREACFDAQASGLLIPSWDREYDRTIMRWRENADDVNYKHVPDIP